MKPPMPITRHAAIAAVLRQGSGGGGAVRDPLGLRLSQNGLTTPQKNLCNSFSPVSSSPVGSYPCLPSPPTPTPSTSLLSSVASHFRRLTPPPTTFRGFSTRPSTSSLSDPNPNWSNRPPKETILLDGCDFEHWLVVVEKPEGDPTRDDIIDGYIKILAKLDRKIYSVSTRHYFAFGALVSEELSYKLKEIPEVRWVLPDSYLDVKNKDYGGEPFINGQAVPYDPKYHEEWVRNNARANERNRRNDRPRNFDRSRNFERRNMQSNQNSPNMAGGPQGNMGPNMGGGRQGNMGPPMAGGPQVNMGPNMAGVPQGNMGPNISGGPPRNMGPNMAGGPQGNMG
ncbi:hypothetical protein Leryth_015925 [Lithospermum erythrorhizon]|nr:hypothetical protein Leryth_015925 [Lithospermum erythrorhizon]